MHLKVSLAPIFVSLALLAGCQGGGGDRVDPAELSSWDLPARVGGLARSEQHLDLDAPELIGHYQSTDSRAAVVASIFVYPAPGVVSIGSSAEVRSASERVVTEQEFEASMATLEAAHEGAELVYVGSSTTRPGGAAADGYLATYTFREPFFGPPTELTSHLYIFRWGDWTVKYRFTYPSAQEADASQRVESFLEGLAWPVSAGS